MFWGNSSIQHLLRFCFSFHNIFERKWKKCITLSFIEFALEFHPMKIEKKKSLGSENNNSSKNKNYQQIMNLYVKIDREGEFCASVL